MKTILKKSKYLILLLGVIIVSIVFFFYHNRPQSAGAAWWNDAWQFRQSILVTNNTSAQNNVYISVTLNTNTASTSMQTDCGDFRFTRENGEVLPYYIVSGCRTATNVIHINFPIFDAGLQAIYFYYGNASAENGFAVSDFVTEASNYTIGAIGTAETGPGPVAYWSFDEGYGTTAYDESGQANTGTITGATWKNDEECVSGKCLGFDGVGDYVDAGTGTSSDNLFTDGGTISLWFKINSWSGFDNATTYLLSRRANPSSGGYYLAISTSTKSVYFLSRFDSQSGIWQLNNKELELNKWIHLEVAYNNNSVSNDPIAYINGFASNVTETQSPIGAKSTDVYNLRIGGVNNSGTYYEFKGFMDEVKMYSYSRTADQIKQDYAAGLAGVETPGSGVSASFGSASDKWLSDGLVGYWKMDETATTSGAIDSSGNGNTGTYYGDASTTAGKFGNGYVGDGTGDYVDLPNGNTYLEETAGTIAMWYKSNGASSGSQLYEYNAGGCDVVWVGFVTSTSLRFSYNVDCSGSLNSDVTISNITTDTNWHYITCSWDVLKQKIILSYDGTVYEFNKNLGSGTFSSANSVLGVRVSGTQYFNGKIDDVRIYNRALSKSEVQRLYEWAPGPVANWKLDEGSGTSAFDTSGFGTNATLTNGPAWVPGKYGQAMSFDGDNDYANFTSTVHNGFNFGKGSFTVGMWLKPESFNCNGGGSACSIRPFEIAYCTASPSYFSISISTSTPTTGNFGLTGYDSSNIQESTYTAGGLVTLNNWYYFTAVIDRTNNIGRAYLNGVQSGSDNALTWTGVFNCSAVSSSATLGGYANNYNYKGQIDDVRIYNYARTQKQILEDMNGGGPANKSPLLHLSFDEGYGTVVHDSSANGRNGTPYPGTGGAQTATSSMWDKSGKFGGAMELDGTDDYVSLPDFSY
jgi:hypothetical protein